jgi:hypothetical protein
MLCQVGSTVSQLQNLAAQLKTVEDRLKERRGRLLTEKTVFSRGGGLVETAADRDLRTVSHLVRSKKDAYFSVTFPVKCHQPGSEIFPGRS